MPRILPLLCLLPLLACGEKEPQEEDSLPTDDTAGGELTEDPATVELAGACPMETDHGGFIVQSQGGSAGVDGAVADGVVPISILEETVAEGDCKVLRRNNPFCDPACEAGQTCDWDGTCIAYPANQDLGTVDIRGLSADVSMEAVFPGNTYYDTTLSDPPWTSGELIQLDMPGGTYGPATLHGVGVDALSGQDELWEVADATDLVVTWDAPTADVVRSEIGLTINIDQHGATPGTLYCTFEDDGEGTVPAAVIEGLVAAGVTGFPSGTLERRTIDHAELSGGGCMDLRISAPVAVEVDVLGYTPCVSDNDCPDGLTCNLELQICE